MNIEASANLLLKIGLALITSAAFIPKLVEIVTRQWRGLNTAMPWLLSAANVAQLILALMGVALLAACAWQRFDLQDRVQRFRLTLASWLAAPLDIGAGYELVHARDQELRATRDFCLRWIGPGLASLKKMRKWRERNSTIFSILVAKRSYEDAASAPYDVAIHAYLGFIPLTESARTALDNDELDGLSFTRDHICRHGERAAGYYIAGIAADHRITRNKVVRELRRRIEDLVAMEPQWFYTRPISADGLRLARGFGFERVDGNPEVTLEELGRKRLSSDDLRSRLERRG